MHVEQFDRTSSKLTQSGTALPRQLHPRGSNNEAQCQAGSVQVDRHVFDRGNYRNMSLSGARSNSCALPSPVA